MLSIIVDDTRDPARNLALDEAILRTTVPIPHDPPSAPAPAGLSAYPARFPHAEASEPSGCLACCASPAAPGRAAAAAVAGPAAPGGFSGGARRSPRPVLRVWQNAPSVVVGRFQNVDEVVDLAACARDGVRVVRRPTGGSAIFTDSGSLNITLVCRAGDPLGRARHLDPRPGPRPDLDVLVATAVEGFGLPAAALRDGVIQTGWLHTKHATLAHATVHVTTVGSFGRSYIAPGGASTEQRTLASHGLAIALDAVRAAVLRAVVDRYGIACARPLDALERQCRDHLLATRYNDVTWHLSGTAGRRVSLGFICS